MTPMDAKTLEALRASIAKWERNAEATDPDSVHLGSLNCPLCRIFQRGVASSLCEGCPVSVAVDNRFCFDTPYHRAVDGLHAWRRGDSGRAFAKAARDEVAFLKSLLPEETP